MDLFLFILMLSASSTWCYPEGLTAGGGGGGGGGGRQGSMGHQSKNQITWFASCYFIGIFVLAPVIASTFTLWIHREERLLKHRGSIFEQNGGDLLMKKLSKLKGHAKKQITLYTADDIRKVTNNYSCRVINELGWPGTFYHGRIAENNENAGMNTVVMNIPSVPESQVEQFVDQLIFLSKPHKNLVRVIGCCLETLSPSLVYELHEHWITLFDNLNKKELVSDFSCEQRIKAAAGVARALAHLHSKNSRVIAHRNVNTASIFLDDDKEAKLLYAVASNLISQDPHSTGQGGQLNEKSGVQGFGKVLSEMLTGALNRNKRKRDGEGGGNQRVKKGLHSVAHLNQKSDVYSFGKVLSDLLIGWKPNVVKRNKHNRDSDGDDQQIKENLALLAEECLSEKYETRPTMKQVEERLGKLMHMRSEKKVLSSVITIFYNIY